MRSISIATYTWVYDNYRLYELPWNSVLTYFVAFLCYDLGYYWFHRASHGQSQLKKQQENDFIMKFI